ncbi:MAG: pentapeptide repeat-containing protein [Trueperaceae bacterium]
MSGHTPADDRRYYDERFESLTATELQTDAADTAELSLAGSEFENCTFVSCNLTEAVLRGARFQDCRFERCELPMVDLTQVALRNVTFDSCRLTGVDFTPLARDPLGVEASFSSCDLRFALFRRLDLTGFDFEGCLLNRAAFEKCDLSGVPFDSSDLQGCLIEECDLTNADLRGARNYLISPLSNKIAGMRVALPEALGLLAALDVVVE